jgi:MSHA pilin protein MshA
MKRQSGFTLIELVVVIVILGILAATAAPKFMNLQGDARISALSGLKGAVKSAVSMTYSKAILKGVEKADKEAGATVCSTGLATATTCADDDTIKLVFGRPDASANGIIKALDIEVGLPGEGDKNNTNSEWNYKVVDTSVIIFSSSSALKPSEQLVGGGCNLVYKESDAENKAPEIKINDKC